MKVSTDPPLSRAGSLPQCYPGKPVMDYEAFFRERQEARYGGKGGPKCC
ncbi:YbdD/YjiX family protein [Pseudomonas corrugata]|nr:YbdD/YjiX family protein [Pseudomonas corrugata]